MELVLRIAATRVDGHLGTYPGQPDRHKCVQSSRSQIKRAILRGRSVIREKFKHEESCDRKGCCAYNDQSPFFVAIG